MTSSIRLAVAAMAILSAPSAALAGAHTANPPVIVLAEVDPCLHS